MFIGEILAYMTQVSDVAPGPLVLFLFFWGGGLQLLSILLMVQMREWIFDHSKDFLAFFTSSTLLINVSRSIHSYRIRYLQFQIQWYPLINTTFSIHIGCHVDYFNSNKKPAPFKSSSAFWLDSHGPNLNLKKFT